MAIRIARLIALISFLAFALDTIIQSAVDTPMPTIIKILSIPVAIINAATSRAPLRVTVPIMSAELKGNADCEMAPGIPKYRMLRHSRSVCRG